MFCYFVSITWQFWSFVFYPFDKLCLYLHSQWTIFSYKSVGLFYNFSILISPCVRASPANICSTNMFCHSILSLGTIHAFHFFISNSFIHIHLLSWWHHTPYHSKAIYKPYSSPSTCSANNPFIMHSPILQIYIHAYTKVWLILSAMIVCSLRI